jgi:flagellar protein FliS
MFGSRQGVHAYANVGIETGAATASPHKLIIMLFDGAMLAIATGLQHMNAGNIPAKGKSISHAITIIDGGLRACLDKENGGSIAENLDALYEYMSRRLLVANLNNQPEILEEVHHLLHDLKQAWEEMDTATAVAESLA